MTMFLFHNQVEPSPEGDYIVAPRGCGMNVNVLPRPPVILFAIFILIVTVITNISLPEKLQEQDNTSKVDEGKMY